MPTHCKPVHRKNGVQGSGSDAAYHLLSAAAIVYRPVQRSGRAFSQHSLLSTAMDEEEAHRASVEERAEERAEEHEGEEPRRILYEIPQEMAHEAEEERAVEAVADEKPAQEAPDAGTPPPPPSVEQGDKLRIDALHLEGEAISQLSTSRLMAYVAHTGSRAKGIEWINDMRCVLVFDTYGDALEGLQRIELQTDDTEMSDGPPAPAPSELATPEAVESLSSETLQPLLRPRLAMAFPSALYNPIEKQSLEELPEVQAKLEEARARLDNSTEPIPEIYKDMELEELEKKTLTRDLRRVKQLRQSLWIRFALMHHDTKAPRSAQRSNWYRQHGRSAGKDIVPRLLQVGEHASSRRRRGGRDELFSTERRYDDHDPYANPRSEQRRGHDWDEDYTPRSLLDRIGGDRDDSTRRPRSRSASPERGDDVRIRGRGSVRAPRARMSGWDD